MTFALFNNARGGASSLQMTPPFAFSDVTMSVFPLRASLPSLENFCRNYLNQAPDMVQFRPFIPFVYLVILDYGRMSLEAANMGWVSQREVAFGVPLRWLNAGSGGLEFHDWAFSSPFIFVDNELSMSTGREVYGWPKLLCRLDPSVSEWVRDPHGARRVFQVSTKGAAQAFAGETSNYRCLLNVYQHRTAGLLDVPPSLDPIAKPLSQASSIAASMTRLSMDLGRTFLGMASDRITGSAVLPDLFDLDTFRRQITPARLKEWFGARGWGPGVRDALWSLFPRLYANTINFKQFRDAADPHATCYQAITAARMPVRSVKEGGFLGPQNMMLGQLDGGFHVEIHHVAGLPIIDSLGLEVASQREADGALVSTLVPIAPLWMKVDMTYGLADTVIWRGRQGDWIEGNALSEARRANAARRKTPPPEPSRRDATAAGPAGRAETRVEPEKFGAADEPEEIDDSSGFDYIRTMNYFNTARGASEAVGGSFSVPDASVRILPLKADADALQEFVRAYLRVEHHMRFEAWGDFVYMIVSDFKQMNSQQSALAKRRARELSFMVPVKCYQWFEPEEFDESDSLGDRAYFTPIRVKRGRKHLVTTGFVNAFTYVDDVETAITANEVFGVPSMGSAIRASENDWLSRVHGSNDVDESILKMRAQVLPQLMVGARAVDRTLVEITGHRDHKREAVQETRQESVNRWVELLAGDIEEKRREAGEIIRTSEELADKNGLRDQDAAVEMAHSFALQLLAGELSFNQFSLKQFRDSAQTENACYQGLVQRRHTIQKLTDVREIPGPLHVAITDFPTQPITKILGLRPKYSYPGKDRTVRVFEPIRPFSLNGDLLRGEGVTLFERAGSGGWRTVDVAEQMFGWRKLLPHHAAELADRAEEIAPLDIVYDFTNPKTNNRERRLLTQRTAGWIKKWSTLRLERGTVKNVVIRQRDDPDTIWALGRSKIHEITPESQIDLAAWIAQNYGVGGNRYSQSAAAALTERFSPATILDQLLSHRWGRAAGRDMPKFRNSDFCVPVTTVPSYTAAALFPEAERQAGYWPQSLDFHRDMMDTRRRRVWAFKFELNNAVRWLALAHAANIGDQIPDDLNGLPSRDEALEMIRASLNVENSRFGNKQNGGADDDAGMSHAIEQMMLQFFDRHVPDSFKASQREIFENMIESAERPEARHDLVPSRDWGKMIDALQVIEAELGDTMEYLARNMPSHGHQLDILRRRARQNQLDMEMLEAANEGAIAEAANAAEAYDQLHPRLKRYMTEG